MKRLLPVFLLCLIAGNAVAQSVISGRVVSTDGLELSGVTIKVFKDGKGTETGSTESDGSFRIDVASGYPDSIVFKLLGFGEKKFVRSEFGNGETLLVKLGENTRSLDTVDIRPLNISEEFSIKKLTRLDIYNNPNAAADPLRAVTFLPSSTTTGETANPSLRGSSPERTAVVLNGITIRNPVRNTQVSGLGNFSLFNPEMIGNLKVYAGNPPLTYGNATGGIVEMETNNALRTKSTQVALSLANAGIFFNRPIRKSGFAQIYSNFQFSGPFLAINKGSFPLLNEFGNNDIGANLRFRINERSYINVYNYFIREKYGVTTNLFASSGPMESRTVRDFSVINYLRRDNIGELSLNVGTDFSKNDYGYMNSEMLTRRTSLSSILNYKVKLGSALSLHGGASYDLATHRFSGREPRYYYAFDHPATDPVDTLSRISAVDVFAYSRLALSSKWLFGAGIRYSPGLSGQLGYTSWQASAKYTPISGHSILLSGGSYGQYSYPNVLQRDISLLRSKQLALDYEHSGGAVDIQFSTFLKREESIDFIVGDRLDIVEKNIKGIEVSLSRKIGSSVELSIANTFLDAEDEYQGSTWRASNDLNYFVKAQAMFTNPALFTLSVAFLTRPGTYYTPIVSGIPDPASGRSEPVFGDYNSTRYNSYATLDVSANKMFSIWKSQAIAFVNVTNVLNRDNRNGEFFNADFTVRQFNRFQKRSVYLGIVCYF